MTPKFFSHFTECDAGFPVNFCSEYELPVKCSPSPKNVDWRANKIKLVQ